MLLKILQITLGLLSLPILTVPVVFFAGVFTFVIAIMLFMTITFWTYAIDRVFDTNYRHNFQIYACETFAAKPDDCLIQDSIWHKDGEFAGHCVDFTKNDWLYGKD